MNFTRLCYNLSKLLTNWTKYMKKLILLGFFALFSFAEAKMINGIALIVNGEPVTTAEIRAVQQQLGVNKKKATDILINDRLQTAAMRKVTIPEDSIDAKIEQIALQNNITVPQMQKILQQQGQSWTKYRDSIKHNMKKEKFYREKVASSVPKPSEDELKLYYEKHKKQFVIPSTVSLVEYSATTEKALKNFLETKKKVGVRSKKVTKSTKDLSSALLSTILRTQDGSYTRPFNAGDKYICYKVLSKNGQRHMSFEDAKGAVAGQWRRDQQSKALKDYFGKIKTNANIQVIR